MGASQSSQTNKNRKI